MRIGIDLGGTKIEGVVLGDDGRVVCRQRLPTERHRGYEFIVQRVGELVEQLEGECGRTCRVGLGHPGSESRRDGTLKNSNTTCLNGRPFRRDLEVRLGRTIRMANDANCFALSEAKDGAGAGARVVFGVILGTGVGGGVVVDGMVHRGPNDVAGEWGHTRLETGGRDCYCGKRGCIEQYLSGPALERSYREVAGSELAGAEIAKLAASGDQAAAQCVDSFVARLAVGLANVINVLDPDVIVLGGGLSGIERLYADLPERLADEIFSDEARTPVLRNHHGDSSGVRGAAFL